MAIIFTKTTYLEMFAPPAGEMVSPRADVHVPRLVSPSNEEYRRLYRGVGSQLNWVDRLLMADDELQVILRDPLVEVYVLEVAGNVAGYTELDRRKVDQIELAYFGLFPEFVGQGLGKFFLNWTLRQVWSYQPKRVWVHTCDLDHPAALPNYVKVGFKIYEERLIEQFVPNRLG